MKILNCRTVPQKEKNSFLSKILNVILLFFLTEEKVVGSGQEFCAYMINHFDFNI